MPEAPYSAEETQRLATIKKLRILGTPAEERFDKITRLARKLFKVSMAAINIVGEKVAWIKSAQGFDAIIGLRKDSYCHYTILNDGVCLINDARKDPRVFDSNFAKDWVFYAGVPLTFEGEHIGVLCIGDTQPRELSDDEHIELKDLAILAERELHIQRLSEEQISLSERYDELEKKNRIDMLTRCWNREAISEIIKNTLVNRKNPSCTLMMIDIDYFKSINDTYGHLAGDHVLRTVTERIRAILKSTDALGRYGGDEFLIISTEASNLINKKAEDICNEVNKEAIKYNNQHITVSCSIGYAISIAEETLEALIKNADYALYKTKANGRNGFSSI